MEHFLRVQLVKLWSSSCTPLFSTLSGAATGAAEPQPRCVARVGLVSELNMMMMCAPLLLPLPSQP